MDTKFSTFAAGLHTKQSIDQYLHFHRSDPTMVALGKMAITYCILSSERSSLLSRKHENLSLLGQTWLMKLFHGMNADTELETVANVFNNVSFICFNYDRCIEVGFFRAIRMLTNAPSEQIGEIIRSNLRIWHPYGTVGELSYDFIPNHSHLHGFPNEAVDYEDVLDGYQRLRTFTEGMDDEGKLSEMHRALLEAEQIVYLGFSFLDQNMELLTTPERKGSCPIYATLLGVSPPDVEQATVAMCYAAPVRQMPFTYRRENVRPLAAKAAEFMDHFGNTLRR
ncbi:hypothetical protein BV98_001423 [Sphingobium herbicidovorans NBRC 16415]|uniref:SIR2-like domain-containing protein n=1 Tax=Sphingobium herbicidovorans (strain ATCC 700291 / DSM 11019 / CCUG 56400 / KCTC 2939 / LMG 18315 / NBRC 16415 / MH) TaxID=1219045 RepID=A0A086PBE3_SPHHM|nr:hypothetical protein BV98_001423 [Sphingobium herbicidovorans NBRC 16415]